MATIVKTMGSAAGRDFPATVAGLQAAWDSIPNDVISSGNSYVLALGKESELFLPTTFTFSGKSCDASHTITLTAVAGDSFLSNANVLTNAYKYNPANGSCIRSNSGYSDALTVNQDWFTIKGLQIFHDGYGNSGQAIAIDRNCPNSVIDNCIVKTKLNGFYVRAIGLGNGTTRNTLVELASSTSAGVVFGGSGYGLAENVTIVRYSDIGSNHSGFQADAAVNINIVNCAVFNCNAFLGGTYNAADIKGSNNASNLTIPFGTGNKPSLVFADQFTAVSSGAPDFRTKSTSALVDAGTSPSTGNNNAPSGARQQGTSADIGAWEYPSPVQSPSATITNIAVEGQKVTISGTTTGTPTSGTISISPSATAYNNAVAQGPISLTLGTNTFSAVFNSVVVGRYGIAYSVSNSNYTVAGANPVGDFEVVGALATSVTQTIDGQVLTVSGSTTGNPTSGKLVVPVAASNPNGAVEKSANLTIGNGTFTVSVTLLPGNYDKGILTLTSAAGTSLPQAGTSPVSVISISGNPSAPGADTPAPSDTTVPVMTGALSISAITATGYTISWQAATDNASVAGYEFSSNGGTSYTNIGSTLTYTVTGAAPNTAYNISVRAVDSSMNKSIPLTTTVTTATADTTAPVMVGTLVVTNVGQTSATISWQAATDATGVTGYERSVDGGTTYVDVGNVLTVNLTGLTAGTTYPVKVRAYDAATNKSAPLSVSLTTTASPDTSAPTMSGTLVVSNIAQTTANIAWTAGADNVGITGYEYSTNGGTSYVDAGQVLNKDITGLTASTTYPLRVRAYDAAGNRSNALSASLTTLSVTDATAPVMVGTISVGAISQTTLALSWQAATDNVVVTGYEYSVDGGNVYTSVGNALGVTAVNLTPDTSYSIYVRAYDDAGNRAIPLSVTARTSATATKFTPSVARTVAVQPSAPNFIPGKFWTLVNGTPRGPKDPDSTIDITFDWAAWLADMGGSSIAKVKFTLLGVQDAGSYATGSKTTVFVSGGTVGTASISCRITTDSIPPRIDERTVYLDLGEQ